MITVTMLTKDSARFVEKALAALGGFDEVIVLDNGSTDNTLEIAARFSNVKIVQHEFIGFGPLKNMAATAAKHDWILNVDSDEIMTPELATELQNMTLNAARVYTVPMLNHYRGKPIRGCGWGGMRKRRLYNRARTQFRNDMVHEKLELPAGVNISDEIRGSLHHYMYNSVHQLLHKMQLYTELFAEQNVGRKKSGVIGASGHALWAFIRDYFIKRGFLDGAEGWLICVTAANVVFYKHMKLREANENKDWPK
ncbi:MAG TPA: glycosyltransferase family 2 protein [Gammaproteobacteria bacterium]